MKIGIGNDHAAVDMKNEISEYLKEKGYEVVLKTFSKDSPPYAEKVVGFEKYFGLPFLETYICVSKNEYIINKAIIEREWLI